MQLSLVQNKVREDLLIDNGEERKLEDLVTQLNTDLEKGLTTKEVAKRINSVGYNVVATVKPPLWKVYLAPFLDTLIAIYLVMTSALVVLAFWNPDITGQILFWFGIIIFNMVLAIFQQFRAQKKLEALQKLSPSMVSVVRDGKLEKALASEIVPGDIVEINLGDKIPADCRIIRSNNLTINESSLTGESRPVKKAQDGTITVELDSYIQDNVNMLYLGTFVVTGNARALVLRTGNRTEIGKIADEMSTMQTGDIPLRRRVNKLGMKLGSVVVVFLILSITSKMYQRFSAGQEFTSSTIAKDLSNSIVVAMSIMPINIPLLTTIVLITGVLHMAKTNVIVKELSVVETLGRTSVLCSDKTGTMTTSKMSVARVWDTERHYAVTTNSTGVQIIAPIEESMRRDASDLEDFLLDDMDIIVPKSALETMIRSVFLNNDANLVVQEISGATGSVQWEAVGNPTDSALLAFANRTRIKDEDLEGNYVLEAEFPFDSAVKRMSKIFWDRKLGEYVVFSKGASEMILERSDSIGNDDHRPLSEAEKQLIFDDIDYYANLGFRVVSVAYKIEKSLPHNLEEKEFREWAESGLTYLGYVALLDPPRKGVKEAVRKLDAAGIFPIMITGDAPTTAATIAAQVGILDGDEIVIEGKDIKKLTDDEFFKVSVFARVTPQHKQIIVEKYQKRGDVVAMTGDGVNDALAITLADAGIAMGVTGTEVAKEAAELIIADDSYVSIVTGIEEGRALYEKIRMIIFFFIAVNIGEGSVYFFTSLFPDLFILNNLQRAYIFSIIHGIPPLVIIIDSISKNTMNLKPRQHDNLINIQLMNAMLIFSGILAFSFMFSYFSTLFGIIPVNEVNLSGIQPQITNDPETLNSISVAQAKARTMFITIAYLTESMVIFSIRRINEDYISSMKDSRLSVYILVMLAPIFHVIMMYSTGIQEYLNTSYGIALELIPFSLSDWLFVIGLSLLPVLALEAYKLRMRRLNVQF